MGTNASTLRSNVEAEFSHACPEGREDLALDELLASRLPADYGLSLAHVAVLWAADAKRDGRFDLPELLAFAQRAGQQVRNCRADEFASHVQASVTLELQEALGKEAGREEFRRWVRLVLTSGDEEVGARDVEGANANGVAMMSRDAALRLHGLLKVADTHGLDFQAFFDLLQQAGEEKGLMSLDNEELDDFVPVEVLDVFVDRLVDGFRSITVNVE